MYARCIIIIAILVALDAIIATGEEAESKCYSSKDECNTDCPSKTCNDAAGHTGEFSCEELKDKNDCITCICH